MLVFSFLQKLKINIKHAVLKLISFISNLTYEYESGPFFLAFPLRFQTFGWIAGKAEHYDFQGKS